MDGYEVELTVVDAAGRRFGGKATVTPEDAERVIAEMGRSAGLFVAGVSEFHQEARKRYNFTVAERP